MAKEGSTNSGFADAFAQAISYALQSGVPLQALVDKFSHARFEPSGMTKNPEVRFAKSIVDYIFRWMATKFLSAEAQFRAGVNLREEPAAEPVEAVAPASPRVTIAPQAAPQDARPRGSAFAAMQNQDRRAAVQHVRVNHDSQRQLLQVQQLRDDVRLCLRRPRTVSHRTAEIHRVPAVIRFNCRSRLDALSFKPADQTGDRRRRPTNGVR